MAQFFGIHIPLNRKVQKLLNAKERETFLSFLEIFLKPQKSIFLPKLFSFLSLISQNTLFVPGLFFWSDAQKATVSCQVNGNKGLAHFTCSLSHADRETFSLRKWGVMQLFVKRTQLK